MRFEVLTNLAEVLELRDEWDALTERALDASPFLTSGWLLSWWRAFSQPEWSMQFCVLWRDEELVAVAPLYAATERRWGRSVRVLRFWTDPNSPRVNVIMTRHDPERVMRALLDHLVDLEDRWDVAELGLVVLQSETTRVLIEQLDRQSIPYGVEPGYESPYRELPADWSGMEETLSQSFKKSLQRKLNKAERSGVHWEVVTDSPRLKDVFNISSETWQHAQGTGIGSTDQLQLFYENIADFFDARGQLQLAFLSLGDRPIAFEYNLVQSKKVYNLKVGFRSDFAFLSPGTVLRRRVLADAISRGYQEFDFMGASEEYKLHWASGVRPHGTVVMFRPAPYWMFMHFLLYRLRPLLKSRFPWALRLKRRLQKGLHRA